MKLAREIHPIPRLHEAMLDDERMTARLLKPGPKTTASDVMPLSHALWQGDAENFLKGLPTEPLFDLIVTSPPYNIGKAYEARMELDNYLEWQARIIAELIPRLKKGGSICWQVGNYVDDNEIFPLDIEFAPIFKKHRLQLRNRIVWQFGHGLHTQRRFSGRYEVVMWYTKTESKKDTYTFNLDAVRTAAKYPGKKHFKGPKAGQFSGNPWGKNPEDVWNIPNVKSNHIEKTGHPCQFPVGLIERLVLAFTNRGDLVFDHLPVWRRQALQRQCMDGDSGAASGTESIRSRHRRGGKADKLRCRTPSKINF